MGIERLDHWSHKWRYRINDRSHGVNMFFCDRCDCISTSGIAQAPCQKNAFALWWCQFYKNWSYLILCLRALVFGLIFGTLCATAAIILLKVFFE